jgi:glycosyltransferase involved in cell wall biosynthesis
LLRKSKIAIVYDGLDYYRESEYVIEEIARMLPHADILSPISAEHGVSPYIRSRALKTTWREARARKRLRDGHLLLYTFASKALDLSGYDLVISNGAGFAGSVEYRDTALHVCYCHVAQPQSLWQHTVDASAPEVKGAARFLLRSLVAGIRRMDVHSSIQPDYYIAKSCVVAQQIQQYYGRKAFVIHPPIDISQFSSSSSLSDSLLIVSSLLPRKHIDMVIAACNSSGRQLIIVGDGPDKTRLESLAGPTVHLLGRRPESEISDLLARCVAVFCPDPEDEFDTMPLKANASGRPAISFAAGSAFETIADGETGVLCCEYSRPAIVDAIERCIKMGWNVNELRAYAKSFDASAFRAKFALLLADICGEQVPLESRHEVASIRNSYCRS